MKQLKGKKVVRLYLNAPEDEYIQRTLEECQAEIPKAVVVARKERNEPSLARICDLSRSLWFAFDAHLDTPELRRGVSRLMQMCVDVTSEVIEDHKFQDEELKLANHYLERNNTRLDWVKTSDREVLRQKKAASLGLCYALA